MHRLQGRSHLPVRPSGELFLRLRRCRRLSNSTDCHYAADSRRRPGFGTALVVDKLLQLFEFAGSVMP